jgi:hypothetical protein
MLLVTLNLVAKIGLRIWVGFGFSWVSGFGSRKVRIFPREGLFRRLQRLLPCHTVFIEKADRILEQKRTGSQFHYIAPLTLKANLC